jgi:hypothetical protein
MITEGSLQSPRALHFQKELKPLKKLLLDTSTNELKVSVALAISPLKVTKVIIAVVYFIGNRIYPIGY